MVAMIMLIIIAHCGTEKLSRDQLITILPPEATDTHKPIAHSLLVNSLLETLSFMELETMGDGFRFSLGLRNANDRSIRLGLVVGVKILVCDNLAFHGDFQPVLAKHSKHFNLHNALAIGIDEMQRNFKPMADQITTWKAKQLTDGQAKEQIYRAFIEDELDAPKHLARIVHKEYFEPSYPEFAPRTAFFLQNAFTSAFKLLDPIPMYKATASLGQFFN